MLEVLEQLIHNYSTLLAIIGATATGIVFIFKKWIIPMFKAIRRYNELCVKIQKIFEEITPNHGKSIKDTIDRVEQKIGHLETTLDEIRYVHLRKLSERQRALLADEKAALFETDSEGNCVWVNRTYARVAGRTPTELYGHGWQNAISREEREYVQDAWYKSVQEDRELVLDFNFETPDGIKTPATVRSYKLVGDKGEVIGYFGKIEIKKNYHKV